MRKTTEAAGVKAVETEWRTAGIPGGVAKRVLRQFLAGREMKEMGSTSTATAFDKK